MNEQRAIILTLLADEPLSDPDPEAMARLVDAGVVVMVDGKPEPSACARRLDVLGLVGV
jgi:hypothetical protein